MSAGNNVGASGSGTREGDATLEENVNGPAGVVDAGVQPADQVTSKMKDLEVGDIPLLTAEEKKVIDELLAQVKDSVKGKALDNSMKTAVQMALRIIKMENSSLNA